MHILSIEKLVVIVFSTIIRIINLKRFNLQKKSIEWHCCVRKQVQNFGDLLE